MGSKFVLVMLPKTPVRPDGWEFYGPEQQGATDTIQELLKNTEALTYRDMFGELAYEGAAMFDEIERRLVRLV